MQILQWERVIVGPYLNVLTMDGAIILWLWKKQFGASPSTLEANFISASQDDRELLGEKELLYELKLSVREPVPMWMDN